MKRLLVLSLCFIMSSFASAGMIGFGVQATGGGISMADPFKKVYNTGFGGGAHVDINLPVILSLRVSGDYVVFSPNTDEYKTLLVNAYQQLGYVASGFAIDGGNINILAFSANAKLGFPLPVISPYLTGGVGSATFSGGDMTVKYNGVTLGQTPGTAKETAFSANIGAGVDLSLIITLYLEAKYTVAFTQGSSSSFVLASLGVTF
jgi:opacity protein-like surface antigen